MSRRGRELSYRFYKLATWERSCSPNLLITSICDPQSEVPGFRRTSDFFWQTLLCLGAIPSGRRQRRQGRKAENDNTTLHTSTPTTPYIPTYLTHLHRLPNPGTSQSLPLLLLSALCNPAPSLLLVPFDVVALGLTSSFPTSEGIEAGSPQQKFPPKNLSTDNHCLGCRHRARRDNSLLTSSEPFCPPNNGPRFSSSTKLGILAHHPSLNLARRQAWKTTRPCRPCTPRPVQKPPHIPI